MVSQVVGTLEGMVCVMCGWWRGRRAGQPDGAGGPGRGVLCRGCAGSVRRGGEVRLGSGLLVRSLFLHDGPIRSAVHALKYRGVDRIAAVLGPWMAELLPPDASALVPVPRALTRRMRYGVDPGRALAGAVGRAAGLPVADVLRAPLVHRSQLRLRRAEGLRFGLAGRPPMGAVLVDDVLTTGATLTAAASACRGYVSGAVTLTRSPAAPKQPGAPRETSSAVRPTYASRRA